MPSRAVEPKTVIQIGEKPFLIASDTSFASLKVTTFSSQAQRCQIWLISVLGT